MSYVVPWENLARGVVGGVVLWEIALDVVGQNCWHLDCWFDAAGTCSTRCFSLRRRDFSIFSYSPNGRDHCLRTEHYFQHRQTDDDSEYFSICWTVLAASRRRLAGPLEGLRRVSLRCHRGRYCGGRERRRETKSLRRCWLPTFQSSFAYITIFLFFCVGAVAVD